MNSLVLVLVMLGIMLTATEALAIGGYFIVAGLALALTCGLCVLFLRTE